MYNGLSMIELCGRRRAALVVLVALAVLAGACSSHSSSPSSTTFTAGTIHRTGALPDGATWELSVPPRWKGTLVLFSHGLVQPGQPNPAHLAADDRIAAALLAAGYALAGSSFKTTGWAVEDALADQTDLLDVFAHEVRAPQRTIAYGASMGGLITTTLLEREPDRFDGGLAVCGVLAGPVALWNSLLDPFFVLATLEPDVAATGPLVHLPPGDAQAEAVRTALQRVYATPAGQARIALAAAVAGFPPLISTVGEVTPQHDLAAQALGEAVNLGGLSIVAFGPRAELEARAGGNPSSNVGVDYADLLRRSGHYDEVAGRYRTAGLSLDQDLAAVAAAPRIAADPAAVRYANEFAAPTGELRDPLLTVNDVGDVLALPGYARAYADKVKAAGAADQLHQAWLQRGGHCTMSAAEAVAAMDALVERITVGSWGDLADPQALDARARRLGATANEVSDNTGTAMVASTPAYLAHDQSPLPRLTPGG
jgi:pimeloyl-ACP methyl ester carboxylesterase